MGNRMGEQNADIRDLALGILMEADRGTYAAEALRNVLGNTKIEKKEDRGFLSRLVEGVTERRITLDQVLDRFGKVPVHKQKPLIRSTLRMGAYQLLYMDSVPDRAAIYESVRLVKKHHMEKLSGFVNAILRKVADWKNTDGEGLAAWMAEIPERQYSTPAWLVEEMEKHYGRDAVAAILASQFAERPLTIRVNRTKTDRESLLRLFGEAGVSAEEGKLSDSAIRVTGADALTLLPGWAEGLFSVQDESSMVAIEAAGIRAGEKVLDLCAAPGGKSMYAAELSGAEVTARDIAPEKIVKIEENAKRLGLYVKAAVGDASVFDPAFTDDNGEGLYDLVICDVPCSGLGVIGKKKDIKYRLHPEDSENLAGISRAILENAVRYVRPGGRILFSTCTILPEENREAAAAFLAAHPSFTLLAERQLLQGIDPCDGFYYAVMKRREA